MDTKSRVARLCLPGRMWYLAVCEEHRWCGMSWKHKEWAISERDMHNAQFHVEADK